MGNRKKSLPSQPKSRFSRLRQTKKILGGFLMDREIRNSRNRQLNVAQNDAPIVNGDIIEGPIHHHVGVAENGYQNYAVYAHDDDEDNTSENGSNCSSPRQEEIIGYKQIKHFVSKS